VYRTLILILLLGLSGYASSHQFTPTYPEWEQSSTSGILQTTMLLFNNREDISFYEIKVYDEEWKSIPFAGAGLAGVILIPYLERKFIPIYIRKQDVDTARYICSRSKIITGGKQASQVSSRICSKLK